MAFMLCSTRLLPLMKLSTGKEVLIFICWQPKNWVFPLATALPLKMYWPVFRGLYWRECKRMAYMTNIQVMSKCRFKNCQNGIFIALRKCFHNSASRAVEKSAGLLHQPMCIGIEEIAPVHNLSLIHISEPTR